MEQTTKEKMKSYRDSKRLAGWRALYFLVPPLIAEKLKAYKDKLKIEHRHLYKRF